MGHDRRFSALPVDFLKKWSQTNVQISNKFRFGVVEAVHEFHHLSCVKCGKSIESANRRSAGLQTKRLLEDDLIPRISIEGH